MQTHQEGLPHMLTYFLRTLIATILILALLGCSQSNQPSANATPVIVIRVGPPGGAASPTPLPENIPTPAEAAGGSPLDPPHSVHLPETAVEVPMQTLHGLPVVVVLINGAGPYRLVVDWGANIFAISPEIAADLQLPILGTDSMGNQNAYVETLSIGEAKFQGLTAVLDTFFVNTDEDGVIGRNVYESLLMTLDYPKQTIKFETGDLPPANGSDILTYTPAEGGAPILDLELNGKQYPAVMDTGASRWLIWPASQIDQLKFIFGPVEGEAASGPQLGVVQTQVGRLADDIHFGGYSLKQPLIDIIDRPEILMGSRLLSNFRITLDQKNLRVRLARPTYDPIVVPQATWEATP